VDNAIAPVVDNATAPIVDNAVAPIVDNAVAPIVDNAVAPVVDNAVAPVVDNAVAPVADDVIGFNKPVVTAKAKVNGVEFDDVNQTARITVDVQKPTLINDRIIEKIAKQGKPLPNGVMGDAHAEIGAIQQAYEAGVTHGADMSMVVTGQPVCGFCIGDIAAMANRAELKSLTILEEVTGNTLFWKPGMKSLKVLN
jgi:tRNA(Arg) A34 adenosine deaminase TadA